jgi:hypothetical protein
MNVAGDLKLFLLLCLITLLSACASSDVTPIFQASDRLPRPERLLVYDFAVSPSESDMAYGADTRSVGSQAQPQPEIQLGKTYAAAVTKHVVEELRSRGIQAFPATEAAPPGERTDTALIKGRFLRMSETDRTMITGFGVADGQVRTRIQVWQGGGLGTTMVAEADTVTSTSLKGGSTSNPPAIIDADAKKTATQIADRILDYYKKRGWIK